MDTTKITAAMIDSAVSRGIKEMEEDPRRTIRKLTDLGWEFSTGRFLPRLFEIFQTILKNDDSPYYAMLESFLSHTDKDNLKKFGINMGYYSWTNKARLLRDNSEKVGHTIPWVIDFHVDIMPTESSIIASDIVDFVSDASPLGINTFSIFLEGDGVPDNSLLHMFNAFPECAFFLFLGKAQITVAQQDMLKKSGNVLILINAENKDAVATCNALNSSGNLYSIYYRYEDSDIVRLERRTFYDELSVFPSTMLFLLRKDSTVKNAGELIKNIRMEQKCPYFIWEFDYDKAAISDILSEKEAPNIAVATDGTVYATDSILDVEFNIKKDNINDIRSKYEI